MTITALPAWSKLITHYDQIRNCRIQDLFIDDPNRQQVLSIDAAGLYFDYSKNLLRPETIALLVELARARDLATGIEQMFIGEPINRTENRAVLHTALRGPSAESIVIDGQPISKAINEVIARMRRCVDDVADGTWRGHSGSNIKDVVNIGIGGSHLGPQLACEALRYEADSGLMVHFLSNVDGGEIDRVLQKLSPETTLFIVASKSFTTPETMLNAASAEAWISGHFKDPAAIASHFLAISAHPARAEQFGIASDNVLPMWDFVGGRLSLWSAIGLPIAFALGMQGFERLLSGAALMDEHFRRAELQRNMPVLLALVGIWNSNFLGAQTQAIVPYDDRLGSLPAYLQQLEMESNGKRVSIENELLPVATAPIVWGGLGTNAQHAFFQLLHQGTRLVPVDFIIAMTHPAAKPVHHDMLVANCLAHIRYVYLSYFPGLRGICSRSVW
jgi:glucose-6-phosphate isomerase